MYSTPSSVSALHVEVALGCAAGWAFAAAFAAALGVELVEAGLAGRLRTCTGGSPEGATCAAAPSLT